MTGVTDDRDDPGLREIGGDGQQEKYLVLPQADREKGFVRPLREAYTHIRCGGQTRMGLALAETYARQPDFYGATYCATCVGHFPVGKHGEFEWLDGTRVGT